MLLNKDQIQHYLPHRDPFLFIDWVSEIQCGGRPLKPEESVSREEVGQLSIQAHFFVPPTMPLLQGHFPGNPILPGVIQVEIIAQAACLLFPNIFEGSSQKKYDVALAASDHAKFRRPVTPGMNLLIKVNCQKMRGPMIAFNGEIFQKTSSGEEQLMSEANILATYKFHKEKFHRV